MKTKKEIKDIANMFLIMNYGNCLNADEPVLEEKFNRNVWRVPINYAADGGVHFTLGLDFIFDADGLLILLPRDKEINDVIKRKFNEPEIKMKVENYGKDIKPETYPEAISETE